MTQKGTEKALKLRYKVSKAYQGYTVSVGYTLTHEGKKRQKDFYLGDDQSKAMQLYLVIKGEWDSCKAKGNPIWTAESLEKVQTFKANLYGSTAVHLPTPPVIVENPTKTFYQLIDEYIANVIPTFISQSIYKKNITNRMNYLKRCSTDFPIDTLNLQKVNEMVSFWKNRPSNLNLKENLNKEEPISVAYVDIQIKMLKRFLSWLYDSNNWDGFRGWEKHVRMGNYKPQLTDKEILEQSKQTASGRINDRFSVEELRILYQTASPETKSYMLLALNCGFTQVELSELMEGEVYLNETPPIIARARRKVTKIDKPITSKWLLWDDTVETIKSLMITVTDDNQNLKEDIQRNIHTAQKTNWKDINKNFETNWLWGKPLVHFNENGIKIDNVRNHWFRLFNHSAIKGKVRYLSFKFLRKTGADMIKQIADEPTSQVYLSHVPTSTAGRHYNNPDFAKLFSALQDMRKQLQPMFEPLPTDKTEGSQL